MLQMAATGSVNAQYLDENLVSLFDAQVHTFADKSTLPFRLLIPDSVKNGKKFPLVVFLHGSGERGDDNTIQLTWGAQEFAKPYRRQAFPAFVLAPQCPENMSWTSFDLFADDSPKVFPQPSFALERTKWLVDYILKEYPIDSSRVYITGLSMGGYGTFEAISRWPEMWSAAAPVCGGAELNTLKKVGNMPIWIFHGAVDEVVPVELSREAFAYLRKINPQVRYSEFPYVDHFSWQPAYATEELYQWMFSFYGKLPLPNIPNPD